MTHTALSKDGQALTRTAMIFHLWVNPSTCHSTHTELISQARTLPEVTSRS